MIILVLLAALAGLVLLVPPPLVGGAVEEALRDQVATLDADPLYRASVEVYERSWFGAEGRVLVGVDDAYVDRLVAQFVAAGEDPAGAEADLAFLRTPIPLHLSVRHGPLTLADAATVGWFAAEVTPVGEEAPVSEALAITGAERLFTATARATLPGDVEFAADVPAMAFEVEKTSVDFAGFTLTGSYDPGAQQLEASWAAPSTLIEDDEVLLTSQGLDGSARGQLLEADLWLGDAQTRFEKVMLVPASKDDGGPITFDGGRVTWAQSLSAREGSVDVAMTWSAGFDVAGEQGSFSVPLEATGINLDALRQWQSITEELYAFPTEPEALDDLWRTLADPLLELLLNSPVLHVGPASFRANADEAEFEMTGATDGSEVARVGLQGLLSPAAIGMAWQFDAALRVSDGLALKAAAAFLREQISTQAEAMGMGSPDPAQVAAVAEQQAGELLAQLVGQGLLSSTADGYTVKIESLPGGIDVNGTPVPLAAPHSP